MTGDAGSGVAAVRPNTTIGVLPGGTPQNPEPLTVTMSPAANDDPFVAETVGELAGVA